MDLKLSSSSKAASALRSFLAGTQERCLGIVTGKHTLLRSCTAGERSFCHLNDTSMSSLVASLMLSLLLMNNALIACHCGAIDFSKMGNSRHSTGCTMASTFLMTRSMPCTRQSEHNTMVHLLKCGKITLCTDFEISCSSVVQPKAQQLTAIQRPWLWRIGNSLLCKILGIMDALRNILGCLLSLL